MRTREEEGYENTISIICYSWDNRTVLYKSETMKGVIKKFHDNPMRISKGEIRARGLCVTLDGHDMENLMKIIQGLYDDKYWDAYQIDMMKREIAEMARVEEKKGVVINGNKNKQRKKNTPDNKTIGETVAD